MTRKRAWLAVSLLLVGGVALWLLRDPAIEGAAGSDTSASLSSQPQSGFAAPDPARTPKAVRGESPAAAAPDSSARSGSLPSAAALPQPKGPADLVGGAGPWSWLYTAPGSGRKSQQEAWNKYVEPLVYPTGHPKAGQYREGLSLVDVVDARMEYVRTMFPEDELDRPQHHIVKSLTYETVNRLAAEWNREDPASGDEFARRLREAPSEPEAREQNMWIPASPSAPEATTNAEVIKQAIISIEAPVFIRPR